TVLKNSLEVLLISDPDTDKCAATMDVRVGHFSDPEGLPGLAHFLEHMLFYASEKYPLEDSYSKYIAEHGGSTNAFTSSEQTNYHFDVNTDCFEEALDSMCLLIKNAGWATGLFAGEADWTLEFSFFEVVIVLTDAGHEHMQDVVGLLFKYIRLLQQSGICKWIFDELSSVCETKFHYQDKITPVNYAIHLACNMQVYPPRDWLVGSSLPSKFSPGTIQMVLEELSIDNEWMLCAVNDNLHLPAPNVFIPTDLSLKDAQEMVKFPVLLRKSSCSRVWYKSDTMFSTPKAYVKIDFNCPHAGNSPEAHVLTDIFTRLLMDYLNEYAYYAKVAGLYYGIKRNAYGFQVTLKGYNDKLRTLLETVLGKIARFKVKPERFFVIKETLTKEYQNFKFQQPYQQAMYYCSLVLEDHKWPWMEELDILLHLEAEDLAKFAPELLSRAFLECYIAGNIQTSEAESMVQYIEDVFFSGPNSACKPLFPSQHVTNRVVKLERGMSYFYPAEGLNPDDENSALVHYIQVHRDDFLLNVKL
ncbi:hypothetical protein F2P56_009899, partial [Juglans regia]